MSGSSGGASGGGSGGVRCGGGQVGGRPRVAVQLRGAWLAEHQTDSVSSASPSQPPTPEVDIESIKQRLADARKSRDQQQSWWRNHAGGVQVFGDRDRPTETEPTTEPFNNMYKLLFRRRVRSRRHPTASPTGNPDPTPTPTDGLRCSPNRESAVELGVKLADMPVLVATPMSLVQSNPLPQSRSPRSGTRAIAELKPPSDDNAAHRSVGGARAADAALASAVEKLTRSWTSWCSGRAIPEPRT